MSAHEIVAFEINEMKLIIVHFDLPVCQISRNDREKNWFCYEKTIVYLRNFNIKHCLMTSKKLLKNWFYLQS